MGPYRHQLLLISSQSLGKMLGIAEHQNATNCIIFCQQSYSISHDPPFHRGCHFSVACKLEACQESNLGELSRCESGKGLGGSGKILGLLLKKGKE